MSVSERLCHLRFIFVSLSKHVSRSAFLNCIWLMTRRDVVTLQLLYASNKKKQPFKKYIFIVTEKEKAGDAHCLFELDVVGCWHCAVALFEGVHKELQSRDKASPL